MSMVEPWVQNSVGIASIFFIATCIVGLVLLSVLVVQTVSLGRTIKGLSKRVETLTDRVQGIADQVSAVTTEVGARTTGIVRHVDDVAGGAFRVVEQIGPILVVFAVFMRLRQMVRRRR